MTDEEMQRTVERLEQKIDALTERLTNVLALRREPDAYIPSVWGAGEAPVWTEIKCTPSLGVKRYMVLADGQLVEIGK